jgi:hypothetical protein
MTPELACSHALLMRRRLLRRKRATAIAKLIYHSAAVGSIAVCLALVVGLI